MAGQSIQQMINALALEIEAIKKRGRSNSVDVQGGEYQGASENQSIYLFLVNADVFLRDDSPIRLVIKDQNIDGSIVSLSEGSLLVSLEKYVGDKITFATLVTDDSFLLDRLKTRLEEVQSGTIEFNWTKANQVIGENQVDVSHGEIDSKIKTRGLSLNAEQINAIEQSLHSEVTYLWGPPGTGKTTVIARIIEGFYRSGKSVLLVSNTNIAVDTALEMVAERVKDDPDFHKGSVLRYGPIIKSELKENFGAQVNIDAIVDRIGAKLSEERNLLDKNRKECEIKLAPLRELIDVFETQSQINFKIKHSIESRLASQKAFSSNQEKIRSSQNHLAQLRQDLERAKNSGGIARFFSGLDPEKISAQMDQVRISISTYQDAGEAIHDEIKNHENQLKSLKVDLDSIQDQIPSTATVDSTSKKIEIFENEISNISQRILEIQKALESVRDQVLGNCRVLASTVYRTFLKGQIEKLFDAVIIDEASMLSLPMSFYVAGLSNENIVVAGDFRQLAPITMSDEPQVQAWMKKDIFYKAGIVDSLKQNNLPKTVVPLRQQYRMHEDICEIANSISYSDYRLITPSEIKRRRKDSFPLTESPIIFVDTNEFNPWTSLQSGTYSRYNLLHALLIRNLASYLSESGYLGNGNVGGNTLGIVSPYAAQTRLIQKMLEETIGSSEANFAATVHRFQGNEKDSMIIDLTDSLGTRPSRFIKAEDIEDDGARLLNVAITRGRHHIIFIGNFAYLRKNLTANTILLKILDWIQKNGHQLDSQDVLALGPEDWFDGLKSLTPPQIEFESDLPGAFTEGTFYSAFQSDLLKASESIVIFSPFLTANGSGRYLDLLRTKMLQGIAIRLVTRPPKNHGGVLENGLTETIQGIRKLGLTIDFRYDMHEKCAVIDGNILWHGSLNIFSHRNTSESMLRIPSKAACDQLARFFSSELTADFEEKSDSISSEFAKQENPNCPECAEITIRRTGRYGLYFECSDDNCPGKLDARRKRRKSFKQRSALPQDKNIPCPSCSGTLKPRNGKFGPFLGCSNYPNCRETQDFN